MLQFFLTPDTDGPGWGFDKKQQKKGNFGKKGDRKRRNKQDVGGLEEAWMRSIKFDQLMLAPGWWLFTEIFTGGEADFTSRDYYFMSNFEIGVYYFWAILYFPFEWVVDAALFVLGSPIYLVQWLVELFDDDKDGRRGGRRGGNNSGRGGSN